MPRLRAGGGTARGATAAFICAHLTVLLCRESPRASQITLATEGKTNNPSINVFNTVVNTCEGYGKEELTVKVLDIMRDTVDIKGNIITFNIALKQLAKAVEGILIGMLNKGLEPNVVSYITTIGLCSKQGAQNAAAASMWLERMRLRSVTGNWGPTLTSRSCCPSGTRSSYQSWPSTSLMNC